MKKQVTIQKMNTAIAEFMGYERYEDNSGVWFKKDGLIISMHPKLEDLKYHSSWDILMPAVEKIESLTTEDGRGEVNYIVTIEPGYCVISVGGEAQVVEVQDHDLVKITIVHQAVYDFINYYNSEKDETR